jgi:hypothetical protein
MRSRRWLRTYSPGVNEPGGAVPPYPKPHDESLADPPAAGNDDVHMVKDAM